MKYKKLFYVFYKIIGAFIYIYIYIYIFLANIKLGDLYLSKEESKDIIEFLTKKRNIKNYKSKSSDKLYNIFKKQSKNKKRTDDIKEELKKVNQKISQGIFII